jgi:hypothetical protein
VPDGGRADDGVRDDPDGAGRVTPLPKEATRIEVVEVEGHHYEAYK